MGLSKLKGVQQVEEEPAAEDAFVAPSPAPEPAAVEPNLRPARSLSALNSKAPVQEDDPPSDDLVVKAGDGENAPGSPSSEPSAGLNDEELADSEFHRAMLEQLGNAPRSLEYAVTAGLPREDSPKNDANETEPDRKSDDEIDLRDVSLSGDLGGLAPERMGPDGSDEGFDKVRMGTETSDAPSGALPEHESPVSGPDHVREVDAGAEAFSSDIDFPVNEDNPAEMKVAQAFQAKRAALEAEEQKKRDERNTDERGNGGPGNLLGGLLAMAANGRGRRLDREMRSLAEQRERLPREFAQHMLKVRRRQFDLAMTGFQTSADTLDDAIQAFNRRFAATEAGRKFKAAIERYAAKHGIDVPEAMERARDRTNTDPDLAAARAHAAEALQEGSVVTAYEDMEKATSSYEEQAAKVRKSMETLAANNADGFDAEAAKDRIEEIMKGAGASKPVMEPENVEESRKISERMKELSDQMRQFVDRILARLKQMLGMRP